MADEVELSAFRAEVAEFCKHWSRTSRRYERSGEFPRSVFSALGTKRWLGPFVPQELGGVGGGIREYVVLEEELAKHSMPMITVQIQCEQLLLRHGSDEQRARFLPQLSTGAAISATAVSERGSGSKLAGIGTRATRRGGDLLHVRGVKVNINLAEEADIWILLVETDSGPTFLLVNKRDAVEIDVRYRRSDTIALRSAPVYNVFIRDLVVPRSCVVGREGDAMSMVRTTFNVSRLGNAAFFIGRSKAILKTALDYASARRIDDEAVVTDFQGIQWTVADLGARIRAASLLLADASARHDAGCATGLETSMAKMFAADVATEVSTRVAALVGGKVAFSSQPYGRFMHEVVSLRVEGGSLEVLRNHVGRRLAADPASVLDL